MSSIPHPTFPHIETLCLILTFEQSWIIFRTTVFFLIFKFLTREEPFRIKYVSAIAGLGLTKLVFINMRQISLVTVTIVSLDRLLCWEDESDLRGNVVFNRKLVSIMIGSSESDF